MFKRGRQPRLDLLSVKTLGETVKMGSQGTAKPTSSTLKIMSKAGIMADLCRQRLCKWG